MKLDHHIASVTPRREKREALAALVGAYICGFIVAAWFAINIVAALCLTFDITMPTVGEVIGYWF